MTSPTSPRLFACAALASLATLSQSVAAGQINGFTWFTGIASVAGEPVDPPTAINNDGDTGDSPNLIEVLQKDYTDYGVVDLVFSVIDSGGVTEYAVIEGVSNNTGSTWGSYHVELGFGNGVGFTKSDPGDGLDFDAGTYDSTADFNPGGFFFPTVNRPSEDDIIATGGTMPDTAYAGNFVFHVDVPDGITEFTIRQSPLPVPEPSSAALLGLLGAVLLRRRRAYKRA
jgi:hypothetical protein